MVNKIPTPKFNVMFKFHYSKYNPQGLFSGELIHGRSFPFQKLVLKRPGAYTRRGVLSEFYGLLYTISYHTPNLFSVICSYYSINCQKMLTNSKITFSS